MWALAALLVLLPFGAFEWVARAHGFRPALTDTPDLWAYQRMQLRPHDARAVVVFGSSKAQLGINLDEFERACGTRPIQLAIDGTSAHAFLEQLARDEAFTGLALVETGFLFDNNERHERRAQEYAASYSSFRGSVARRFDFRLHWFIGQALAIVSPDLSARRITEAFSAGHWPRPSYLRMSPDRGRFGDYQMVDSALLQRLTVNEFTTGGITLNEEQLAARLARVEAAVTRIQARGGRVVIIRMPPAVAARDDSDAARWEAVKAHTSALCLSAADDPVLASFKCPDGNHLDYRDAARFTRALVAVLRTRLAERGDTRLQ
jgi:hypothetical protein